jgi:pilus assembly protein CpaE
MRRLLRETFDVVVIDLDSNTEYALDLVECICVNHSATIMVYSAHSAQSDAEMLLRCMRAGAREYLTLPLTHSTMVEALVRASAHRPAICPAKKADGRLLVFMGAKGGTGVTTLACNYAVSLARESGQKTLLIDLDLPMGDVALNLGIKAQYSTLTALENFCRLDGKLLSTMLAHHDSGLSVLAAPGELVSTEASNDAIDKLLEVARQEFNYVVVDIGSRLDLQHTVLFDKSATIYLVTQIGIPDLRNSNRFISKYSAAGSPNLEIVINRFDPSVLGIDEEHIRRALTRSPQWKIPESCDAVRRAQNTANPFALENSPISRSIRQMVRSVCGRLDIPEKKKWYNFSR